MSTNGPSSPDAAALASMVPVPAERDMPPDRQQAILEYLMNEVSESAGIGVGSPRRPGRRGRRVFHPSRRALIAVMAATASATVVVFVLISVFSSQSLWGVHLGVSAAFRTGTAACHSPAVTGPRSRERSQPLAFPFRYPMALPLGGAPCLRFGLAKIRGSLTWCTARGKSRSCWSRGPPPQTRSRMNQKIGSATSSTS